MVIPSTPAINRLREIMGDLREFDNSLVILKTTPRIWAREKLEKYPQIKGPPDGFDMDTGIYQVRAGHTRIRLLMEWGIKEAWCVVFDTAEEAAEEMHKQAKWHKQRWGALE